MSHSSFRSGRHVRLSYRNSISALRIPDSAPLEYIYGIIAESIRSCRKVGAWERWANFLNVFERVMLSEFGFRSVDQGTFDLETNPEIVIDLSEGTLLEVHSGKTIEIFKRPSADTRHPRGKRVHVAKYVPHGGTHRDDG